MRLSTAYLVGADCIVIVTFNLHSRLCEFVGKNLTQWSQCLWLRLDLTITVSLSVYLPAALLWFVCIYFFYSREVIVSTIIP